MKKNILVFALAIVILLSTAMPIQVFADSEKKDLNDLEFAKELTSLVNKTDYDSEDKADIESIIKKYYDISYGSYFTLELQDMSTLIDVNSLWGKNFINVMKENIETIKYVKQKCYDVTQSKKIPIRIEIVDISVDKNTAVVTINIDGNKDECYPLFICLDENVFKLKKIKECWKIVSVSNNDKLFKLLNEEKFKDVNVKELHSKLDKMYSYSSEKNDISTNYETREYPFQYKYYDNGRAVQYAHEFADKRNTFFYDAGMDCTNFVSQCVSYGFGDTFSYDNNSSYRMIIGRWSAGSGGGFPAWEAVGHHWNYMFENKYNKEGPVVYVGSLNSLSEGDIMQIDFNDDGVYDHSVICVSKLKKEFAQHSGSKPYNNFYAYIGEKRFYKPSYFKIYW